MPNQTRIAVIDDHPLLRQGIAAIINADKKFTVCAETDDSRKALEIIKTGKPDALILDISLKGASGIEVMKDIRVQYPKLPVLVLSMHDENIFTPRALRAGASGYLNKSEAADKVLDALRKILSGQIYLSEKMSAQMLQQAVTGRSATASPVDLLSDRELEVLQLLGNGIGTREIADKLHLSIKTVESHRAHIKEKLNLKTATELMHYAVQWVEGEAESSR